MFDLSPEPRVEPRRRMSFKEDRGGLIRPTGVSGYDGIEVSVMGSLIGRGLPLKINGPKVLLPRTNTSGYGRVGDRDLTRTPDLLGLETKGPLRPGRGRGRPSEESIDYSWFNWRPRILKSRLFPRPCL